MSLRSFPFLKLTLLPKENVIRNVSIVDIVELADISKIFHEQVKNIRLAGVLVSLLIGRDSTCVIIRLEKGPASERITFCFEDTTLETEPEKARLWKLGTLKILGMAVPALFGSSWRFKTTDRHHSVAQVIAHLKDLFPRMKIYEASVSMEHVSDVEPLRNIFRDIKCDELRLHANSWPIEPSEQISREENIRQFMPMVQGVKKLTLTNSVFDEAINVEELTINGEWVTPEHLKTWDFNSATICQSLFTTEDFVKFINSWKEGRIPSMENIEIFHQHVYWLSGKTFDHEKIAEMIGAKLVERKWNEVTYNVKRYNGTIGHLTIGKSVKLEICDLTKCNRSHISP